MSVSHTKQPFPEHATGADEAIPILDLAPCLREQVGAAEATSHALRASLEGIGFFYLINHGISERA